MDILVLHPGALGDLILSFPALGILRDHFPGASLTLAANADFAALAVPGYADRILALAAVPLHRLYGPEPPGAAERAFFAAYERILSWTGSGDVRFGARLEAVHPQVLVKGWKPAPGEYRHVSRLFVDSLAPWLSPPHDVPVPRITIPEVERRQGAEWLCGRGWDGKQPIVALHPGAGSEAKRWPLSRFREVARAAALQARVLIIEGPAEPGLGRELASGLTAGVMLARNLPLPQLAGVLTHGRAFAGGDSGIAHLAAGLGLASVVLFGPTRPEHWAPLGPEVSVLRGSGGCPACGGSEGALHVCLESIPVEAVVKKLRLPPGQC